MTILLKTTPNKKLIKKVEKAWKKHFKKAPVDYSPLFKEPRK